MDPMEKCVGPDAILAVGATVGARRATVNGGFVGQEPKVPTVFPPAPSGDWINGPLAVVTGYQMFLARNGEKNSPDAAKRYNAERRRALEENRRMTHAEDSAGAAA